MLSRFIIGTKMPTQILIVDDNLENVKILRSILRKEGYVLLDASDGVEPHCRFSDHPSRFVDRLCAK